MVRSSSANGFFSGCSPLRFKNSSSLMGASRVFSTYEATCSLQNQKCALLLKRILISEGIDRTS
jgi:hypothetical protein